jgi:hypothetical protein
MNVEKLQRRGAALFYALIYVVASLLDRGMAPLGRTPLRRADVILGAQVPSRLWRSLDARHAVLSFQAPIER